MTIYSRFIQLVGGFLAAATFFAYFITPAQALTVAPNRFTPNVAPGESAEKKIGVTNETGTDQTYQMSLVPFSTDSAGNLLLNQGADTALSWITLDQTVLTLAPQATQELTATIAVPEDTVPSGYAVAVLVTPSADSGETVSVTRVFLTVKGAETPAATISVLTTPKSVYAPEDQIVFHIEMQNTGVTHLTPIGQIDLYRGADWVGDIQLNDTKDIVLPGTSRNFDVVWNSALGFGKYTTVVTLNADDDFHFKSAPLTFWVLSWERILPVVVLLVTFLIAASVLLRHPSKG